MKGDMDMMVNTAVAEGAAFDIEAECRAWDWARTAGVSAEELRRVVQDSVASADDLARRLAKAA